MLGIDPFETKIVEFEGAKFTIGHIPARRKIAIQLKFPKIGEKIAQAKEKKIEVSILLSSDEVAALMEYDFELVRYGTKGHEGFRISDKDIPFEKETVTEFGKSVEVVSDKLMEYYFANGIISFLAPKISEMISTKEKERKN